MATKYSKQQYDGTVEHYDTREEMEAANPPVSFRQLISDISGTFNPVFAIGGFILAGIVCILTMSLSEQFANWATWLKFFATLGIATLSGYAAGKIGNAVFMISIVLFLVGVVAAIATLVWYLLA